MSCVRFLILINGNPLDVPFIKGIKASRPVTTLEILSKMIEKLLLDCKVCSLPMTYLAFYYRDCSWRLVLFGTEL